MALNLKYTVLDRFPLYSIIHASFSGSFDIRIELSRKGSTLVNVTTGSLLNIRTEYEILGICDRKTAKVLILEIINETYKR